MEQDTDRGSSYLAALKQAATPAASAPAPARENGPASQAVPTETSFTGPDKRRSPRYKCAGSVQFRQEGSEVWTWATFSDVSLHGCFVDATATYPVGTMVDAKMEVNGIRVHTKGEVRVSYPLLGMGVAFTEMSEEDRGHLLLLVRSIASPSTIMGPGVNRPALAETQLSPKNTNAEAILKAITSFFNDRQLLPREEFFRILKKAGNQKNG